MTISVNIQKRPNGVYRLRWRDEAKHEHTRHFKLKTDADKFKRDLIASAVTGSYVDPRAGQVTFNTYFDDLLERRTYETTTITAMRLAAKATPFGHLPLAAITHIHVQRWVKTMHETLAPGTIRTRVHNVRTVFRAAVEDKRIAADPTSKVKLPKAPTSRDLTIPSPHEVAAIMRGADDSTATFVALCSFAGLRLGEAAALKVSDVDFTARRITVRRQVQRATAGKVEVRAPKYGSKREVAVPKQLTHLLAAHVTSMPPADGRDRFLFTDKDGVPVHQNTIGHRWRKALKRAGLSGIKVHDLRHFYASGLIHAGCDPATVQAALGHQKLTTTLNTYTHLWPKADERARAAASDLMDEVARATDLPVSSLDATA